jgi:hypothetical protein
MSKSITSPADVPHVSMLGILGLKDKEFTCVALYSGRSAAMREDTNMAFSHDDEHISHPQKGICCIVRDLASDCNQLSTATCGANGCRTSHKFLPSP